MPKLVVDRLEAIKVHKNDGKLQRLGPPPATDFRFPAIMDRPPVGELG
nr:hypothetical protein [Allorhizobium ampelinum]